MGNATGDRISRSSQRAPSRVRGSSRRLRLIRFDTRGRGVIRLFRLGLATKIYVAVEAVDMRKGFDGLYGAVRDQLWDWLHVGRRAGRPRVAAILSVVESWSPAWRAGQGIPRCHIARIESADAQPGCRTLTPARWSAGAGA